ncbi:MAG: type IVB secretion system protein IcmH/DotU [Pseudomonadota bacterium]
MTASMSDPIGTGTRIVLPTPGGKRPTEPAEAPRPESAGERTEPGETLPIAALLETARMPGGEIPLLVAEAAPLLSLAHTLNGHRGEPDIAELRASTVQAVKDYEAALLRAGIVPEQARAAHYIICATLDDVIRNTVWGGDWANSGLVSTFHIDVTGGDKVFELLEHFQRNPGGNRDVLMLLYLCLSLGFQGRTRVSPRGSLELAQVRDGLYRTLRTQLGNFERDLSPNWRGEAARHQGVRRERLFWGLTGLLVILLAIGFVALLSSLNRQSDAVLASLAALPPVEAPSLFVPEPPAPVVPVVQPDPEPVIVPPPVEPLPSAVDSFIAFLEPEVNEGLVELFRDGEAVLVRVANAGSFAPGSAVVEPEFETVFERIGQALAADSFDITILGHTDSRPIGNGLFDTNYDLSAARAEVVRRIVLPYVDASRVETIGKADLEPIASNETAEGREANRRTELLVLGEGARASNALLELSRRGVIDTGAGTGTAAGEGRP